MLTSLATPTHWEFSMSIPKLCMGVAKEVNNKRAPGLINSKAIWAISETFSRWMIQSEFQIQSLHLFSRIHFCWQCLTDDTYLLVPTLFRDQKSPLKCSVLMKNILLSGDVYPRLTQYRYQLNSNSLDPECHMQQCTEKIVLIQLLRAFALWIWKCHSIFVFDYFYK